MVTEKAVVCRHMCALVTALVVLEIVLFVSMLLCSLILKDISQCKIQSVSIFNQPQHIFINFIKKIANQNFNFLVEK